VEEEVGNFPNTNIRSGNREKFNKERSNVLPHALVVGPGQRQGAKRRSGEGTKASHHVLDEALTNLQGHGSPASELVHGMLVVYTSKEDVPR